MDGIREYLLQIVSTAMLCGLVTGLVGKKGALGATLKLLTGIFMIFTVVSPFATIRVQNFSDFLDELSANSEDIVANGEAMAGDALAAIIKSETEAYILDKAEFYGAELSVEVSVTCSDYPVPCAVNINGNISPYGRRQLQKLITDELGIELEDQTWTG